MKLENDLKEFLVDGPERVGFLLKNGELIEVNNICHDAEMGFEVSADDLLKYEDDIVASWHTHPGDKYTSNLTMADMTSFLAYPAWRHYIVAQDGVSCFVVENGKVLVAS